MRYAILSVALLSACSPIAPLSATGNFLTTQHGSARFGSALEGAQQHCAGKGMEAKHLGTDHAPNGTAISRFECVKNQ